MQIARRVSFLGIVSILASTLVVGNFQPAHALDCQVASGFSAGGGSSASDAYEIDTIGELQYLTTLTNDDANGTAGKFFKLTSTIDLDGCFFTPIGSAVAGKQFKGAFDGNGFEILGLNAVRVASIAPPIVMASIEDQDLGLFGVTDGAIIKDVTLREVQSIGTERVGALVGLAHNTSVEQVEIHDSTVVGTEKVGAVAGSWSIDAGYGGASHFREIVVAQTNISGLDKVGGMVGEMSGQSVASQLYVGEGSSVTLRNSPGGTTGTVAGGLIGSFINNSGTSAISIAGFWGSLFIDDGAGDQPIVGGLVGSTIGSASALNITESLAMGITAASAGGAYSGIIGDGKANDTLEHVYTSIHFFDPNGYAEIEAYPFLKHPGAFVKESFVDNTVHTVWNQAIVDLGADIFRTELQMQDPSNFTNQAWVIETDPDLIRGKASAKPWYQHPSLFRGLPGHMWIFNASIFEYPCNYGSYSVDGQAPCTQSQPGFFVNAPEATMDVPCRAGTFSASVGSAFCNEAREGYFVEYTQATMDVPCRAGFFQDLAGQTECKVPQAGRFAIGEAATFDVLCRVGTFKPTASADDCTPAEAGKHVPIPGSTAQVDCEPGTFQEFTGQPACDPAPPGSYVEVSGSASATRCPWGTYQPQSGQFGCIPAEAGHYAPNTGDVERTQCNPGTFQPNVGATTCEDARAGYFATGPAAEREEPCAAGTYSTDPGTSVCIVVPAGKRASAASAATGFVECLPGTYQPNPGSITCLNSGEGYFVADTADVERVACQPGTYQPFSIATECLLASPGRFVAVEASYSQTLCAPGTFQSVQGQDSCELARPGFFVAEAGAITDLPCPEGLTSFAGAIMCTPPGGGGGGGGGFFFPVQEPAAPISENPAGAGGSAVVDAEGRPVAADVTTDPQGRSLEIRVGGTTLQLGSSSGGLSKDKTSALKKGTKLVMNLAGFAAGTTAVVYLLPESVFVAASSEPFAEIVIDQGGNAVLDLNLDVAPGKYAIQISGLAADQTALSFVINIQIVGDTAMAVWTKRLTGNLEAKLYAKSIVGAGKVSFRFNGKEIAWIRAVDETDPKLRVVTTGPMTGANYLVRTVKLKAGKNILEIFLNGERLRRTSYSR